MRTFILSVLVLAAVIAEDQPPLRIAIQPYTSYAPAFIAKQKGWLEEALKPQGVSVVWSSFKNGPLVNESFASGGQDIGVLGDSPAIIARSAGQDTRIFALTSWGPSAFAVVVPKASPLTTVAQLKGKRVGFVKGSYAHHLLYLLLEKAGLGIADIEAVNLDHADIGIALQKGDIDAGVIWEPLLSRLEEAGAIRVIADGTGVKKGLLVHIATRALLDQRPELVRIYLRTYQRGAAFLKEHPEEAYALVSREVGLPADKLAKVLGRFTYDVALRPEDAMELEQAEAFQLKTGITRRHVDIPGFIDRRILDALDIR